MLLPSLGTEDTGRYLKTCSSTSALALYSLTATFVLHHNICHTIGEYAGKCLPRDIHKILFHIKLTGLSSGLIALQEAVQVLRVSVLVVQGILGAHVTLSLLTITPMFVLFLYQPFDEAEPSEFKAECITAHTNYAGQYGWWPSVLCHSRSGHFDGGDGFIDMQKAYDICEHMVVLGEVKENMLIEYVRKLPVSKKSRDFASDVAKVTEYAAETLFPHLYSKVSKKAVSTTKGSIGDDHAPVQCRNKDIHTTYNFSVYDPEEVIWFWQGEGRKYSSGKHTCQLCHKIIGCKMGMEQPSTGKPIYVCHEYSVGKSNCQCMVCNKCFTDKLLASTSSVAKRATRRDTK